MGSDRPPLAAGELTNFDKINSCFLINLSCWVISGNLWIAAIGILSSVISWGHYSSLVVPLPAEMLFVLLSSGALLPELSITHVQRWTALNPPYDRIPNKQAFWYSYAWIGMEFGSIKTIIHYLRKAAWKHFRPHKINCAFGVKIDYGHRIILWFEFAVCSTTYFLAVYRPTGTKLGMETILSNYHTIIFLRVRVREEPHWQGASDNKKRTHWYIMIVVWKILYPWITEPQIFGPFSIKHVHKRKCSEDKLPTFRSILINLFVWKGWFLW